MVQMNLYAKWKQSHRYRKEKNIKKKKKQQLPRRNRGGITWETGIFIYTPLYVK